MSIIEPRITDLLDATDNDRFLLCALASKRAHDINDMMRGRSRHPVANRCRNRQSRRQEAAFHGLLRNRPRRRFLRSGNYRRRKPLNLIYAKQFPFDV